MKIVLEQLSKHFASRDRKGEEVIAVDNFDLEIPDGMLVSLLGPSGCGKSTTLNMICGLEEPTAGHIYFGDSDVTNVPVEHRGVGMVFQSYALYPHLTVRENILFPLQNVKKPNRLSKEDMEARCQEVASLVQIVPYLDRKPSELSGGQQQRVAIARALAKMPSVLLLDEPLSNLDARLRLQTREEIRRIQKETKITTVFVTHDQEEAMSISDLCVVMCDGKLQQVDKPQNIYDHPVNLFVAKFLGTPAINVFEGKVEDNQLIIGDEVVLHTEGLENQKVHVGIRPEGFVIDQEGPIVCESAHLEVSGRDTSIVFTHAGMSDNSIRAIVPGDTVTGDTEHMRLSLKPYKVHLFDWNTEESISVTFTEGKL